MKMAEKIAKALAANAWKRASGVDSKFMSQQYPGGETDYVAQRFHLYEEDARAAIEVMREPTDDMLEAPYEAEIGFGPGGTADIDATPSNVWATMIDAALK